MKEKLEHLSQELDLSIREDKQIEERLLHNLEKEYSTLRATIHVSDLTLCVRQSAFKKLYPSAPTIRQLGYFLDGARRHETLQKLYGAGDPGHIVTEKKGQFEGVNFSIDIYHGMPIEFKTTRASEAIPDHWLRQLAYYMLASNSNVGILQIQRIMPRQDTNIFPSFLVEFRNADQKELWLLDFRLRANSLRRALDQRNLMNTPIYRGDRNWVCKECAYKARCGSIEKSIPDFARLFEFLSEERLHSNNLPPPGGRGPP